jgi:hypothetical protein
MLSVAFAALVRREDWKQRLEGALADFAAEVFER